MSCSVPHSIEAQRLFPDRLSAGAGEFVDARSKDPANAAQTRASSDYVISLSEEAKGLQAEESRAQEKQQNDATDLTDESETKADKDDKTANAADKKAESATELTEDEQQKVDQMKARDEEVRIHEQAHAATGGQYAGTPSYTYEQGPDGKRYITDGEVPIDISEVSGDPQATIDKMRQVYRAANAPAEPSSADRSIANEAQQKISEAQSELTSQARADAIGDDDKTGAKNDTSNAPGTGGADDQDTHSSAPQGGSRSTFEISQQYQHNGVPQGSFIDLTA